MYWLVPPPLRLRTIAHDAFLGPSELALATSGVPHSVLRCFAHARTPAVPNRRPAAPATRSRRPAAPPALNQSTARGAGQTYCSYVGAAGSRAAGWQSSEKPSCEQAPKSRAEEARAVARLHNDALRAELEKRRAKEARKHEKKLQKKLDKKAKKASKKEKKREKKLAKKEKARLKILA